MSDVQGSHSARVEAPAAACLALLTDFERYPTWYETLDAVAVIRRDRGATVVGCVADAGPLGSVEFDLLMETGEDRLVGRQVGGNGRVEHVAMEWVLESLSAKATTVRYSFSADAASRGARLALRAARPLVERGLVREPVEALRRTLESNRR